MILSGYLFKRYGNMRENTWTWLFSVSILLPANGVLLIFPLYILLHVQINQSIREKSSQTNVSIFIYLDISALPLSPQRKAAVEESSMLV